MEPLLPHFCAFYEMDERLTPPLKLEACAKLQVGRAGGQEQRLPGYGYAPTPHVHPTRY